MLTFATFLVVCFVMALIGLLTTIGWRYLLAYIVPITAMLGIPALAYFYERDPEAYMIGANSWFSLFTRILLIIAIVGVPFIFKYANRSMKAQRESAVKKFRDIDGFYGGKDSDFMRAVTICALPHNAINPMTGKRYTSAELDDDVLLAAWFHDPNKMVYDYETGQNVPYKK